MVTQAALDRATRAERIVADVADPELPVVTIGQLGILRDVVVDDDGTVAVTITPTYSGCPAMDAIRDDIRSTLRQAGFDRVDVHTSWSPAWTTDWISPDGRETLRRCGIAPPGPARAGATKISLSVRCPRCGSLATRQISRFGSTACKAIYRCADCAEPFDHVKPL